MKKQVLALAMVLCAYLPASYSQDVDDQAAEIEANAAIVDATVRSLSEMDYVRELLVVDFSKSARMPGVIGFEEEIFKDDGMGNDERAGDGIYTSVLTYQHDEKVPFNKSCLRQSVLEASIVDESFRHDAALEEYVMQSKSVCAKGDAGRFGISVTCDVHVCFCSKTCRCPACIPVPTFPTTGWVCVKLSNCKISFGWTLF